MVRWLGYLCMILPIVLRESRQAKNTEKMDFVKDIWRNVKNERLELFRGGNETRIGGERVDLGVVEIRGTAKSRNKWLRAV